LVLEIFEKVKLCGAHWSASLSEQRCPTTRWPSNSGHRCVAAPAALPRRPHVHPDSVVHPSSEHHLPGLPSPLGFLVAACSPMSSHRMPSKNSEFPPSFSLRRSCSSSHSRAWFLCAVRVLGNTTGMGQLKGRRLGRCAVTQSMVPLWPWVGAETK
jgi:hypothetical protein